MFFRAPRGVGVTVLFLQAGVSFFLGGWLGLFFIIREFETYHFSMDAEKLGEYWFVFEAVAFWTLAAATLAVIRTFAPKQVAEQTIMNRRAPSLRSGCWEKANPELESKDP